METPRMRSWSGCTQDQYWRTCVSNNQTHISEIFGGIKIEPETEEIAREIYHMYLKKIDPPQGETQEKTQMTLKQQLRTLWHEFWIWYHFGSATTIEVVEDRKTEDPPLKVNAWVKPSYKVTSDAYKSTVIDWKSLGLSAKEGGPRVWIYNVSRMEHRADHPLLRNVCIPANTTRKRYTLYTSLPYVVVETQHNIDSNETYGLPSWGKRLAMDLINPDNLGLDQTAELKYSTGIGRNLGEKGVFWSLNNPPLKAEVDAAVERMEVRYKMLLEKAAIQLNEGIHSFNDLVKMYVAEIKRHYPKMKMAQVRMDARKQAQSQFQITPEHHAAAEHYKLITDWHPILGGTR